MSPKIRTINRHLPANVHKKHNAYYYVTPRDEFKKRKWIFLGKDFNEAMAKWSEVINPVRRLNTMNQIFDRYMLEIAPKKSKETFRQNLYQIKNLRTCFGDMDINDITPVDIYAFIDARSRKAKVGANREKALLSHVFSMAIKWGLVNDNPCKHVKRITERPRDRYIEDWEYKAVRSIAIDIVRVTMDFAYITGQRIGDILTIKLADLSDQGIKITQRKTKSKIIIQWSDELRNLVNEIRKLRSPIFGLTLICNRKGQPYTTDGFSTLWQRTIKKALKEKLINESFTFHDIRAKTRSDSDDGKGASELLGHADQRITDRVYNRVHKKVRPLK